MSMPDPLAVVIDRTPHSYLLPNAHKHRRTQEPYRNALKQSAAAGALNALKGRRWGWTGPILLRVEVWWERGRNQPDWDNTIASLKSAVDGIFDKIDANDRQVAGIYLQQARDPLGDGYCVILVEPVEVKP